MAWLQGFGRYLVNHYRIFAVSFKGGRRFFYVALIEMLFFSIAALTSVFLFRQIMQKAAVLLQAPAVLQELAGMDEALQQAQIAQVEQSIYSFIGYVILWIILMLLFYTSAKGSEWVIIVRHKGTFAFYGRFLAITATYLVCFICLSVLAFVLIREELYAGFFVLAILPFSLYYLSVMQPVFAFRMKIWQGLRTSLWLCFARIHYLLFVFAVAFLVLVITNMLFLAAYQLLAASQIILVAYLVFMAFFIAWVKFYFAAAVKSVLPAD